MTRVPAFIHPACRCRPLGRRGMTLIEVLVAVSLVSFALGAVGVLLHGMWRAEITARNHGAASAAVAAVAEQFREDVHLGKLADADAAPGGKSFERLTLALADGKTVEYEFALGRVTRVERREERVVRRQAYRLPRGTTVAWQVGSLHKQPCVSLLISRPAESTQPELADRHTLRVDGLLGWHDRVTSRGA